MPRGGHRGGIYPISGLSWGPGQRYLKRGLYHHQRSDIFTPRWGMKRDRINPSPYPDGSTKKWERDSDMAWHIPGQDHHVKMYNANESSFLAPAFLCTHKDPRVKQYIMNALEWSPNTRRIYSGIGRMDTVHSSWISKSMSSTGVNNVADNYSYLPAHFVESAKSVGAITNSLETSPLKPWNSTCGRIKNLYNIVCESDVWRSGQNSGASIFRNKENASKRASNSGNPFPNVDETAALVRELPLAEILYSRSNHRLKSRRHPYWTNLRYIKDKSKIPYLHRRKIARQERQEKQVGAWQSEGQSDIF